MNEIQIKIEEYENILDTLQYLVKVTEDRELKQQVLIMIEILQDEFGTDYNEWIDIVMQAENEEKEQMEIQYWADQF